MHQEVLSVYKFGIAQLTFDVLLLPVADVVLGPVIVQTGFVVAGPAAYLTDERGLARVFGVDMQSECRFGVEAFLAVVAEYVVELQVSPLVQDQARLGRHDLFAHLALEDLSVGVVDQAMTGELLFPFESLAAIETPKWFEVRVAEQVTFEVMLAAEGFEACCAFKDLLSVLHHLQKFFHDHFSR